MPTEVNSAYETVNWSGSDTLQLKQCNKAECYNESNSLQSKHYETYTSVHLYDTVPSRKIST